MMEMDRDSWIAELLFRINCTLYIVQYHYVHFVPPG